jgi:hypothetical protein
LSFFNGVLEADSQFEIPLNGTSELTTKHTLRVKTLYPHHSHPTVLGKGSNSMAAPPYTTAGASGPSWLNDGINSNSAQDQPQYASATSTWQQPVAAFAADKAWEEYGGTAQVDQEHEIPDRLKLLIRSSHIITAFFLGLAGTLNFLLASSFRDFVVSRGSLNFR